MRWILAARSGSAFLVLLFAPLGLPSGLYTETHTQKTQINSSPMPHCIEHLRVRNHILVILFLLIGFPSRLLYIH